VTTISDDESPISLSQYSRQNVHTFASFSRKHREKQSQIDFWGFCLRVGQMVTNAHKYPTNDRLGLRRVAPQIAAVLVKPAAVQSWSNCSGVRSSRAAS
jgi:hypothetical protein